MGKESWRELAAKLVLDLEAAMGKEPRELATKLVLDLLNPLDRSGSMEWVPALVAIEHTKAPEHIVVRKTVLIGHDDDSKEEQKDARQALLKIRWLTSRERSAIMAQLGRRLEERNAGVNKAQAATLMLVIEWVKEITKIQGGFYYKTCAFCWMKADNSQPDFFQAELPAQVGMGYWTGANTEPCLLATRGHPKRLNADVRQGIIAPRREHSRKPDGIHDRIERLVAGPYLELFARQTRPGWTCWGDEVGKFDPQPDSNPALHRFSWENEND